MPTVGQINDKISELRSKIAITEGLVLHLKTNYLSSDSGDAEMHFMRADNGQVPQGHVQSTIADYVEYVDTLRAELEQWEGMNVVMPEPAKLVAKPEPEKPTPPQKGKHVSHAKEPPSAAARADRRDQDHTAPGGAVGRKAG
jgi:hypothetical protein